MSKYTTELRWVLETLSGESDVKKAIQKGSKLLFDFQYPFYQSDKTLFQEMFCKNFYTREIATETIGLWKLRLDNWCNVNMPYYNELFIKTAKLQELDIFINVNTTEIEKRSDKGTTKDSTEDNSNTTRTNESNNTREKTDTGSVSGNANVSDITKYSDTPQGGLTNIDNGEYLSEYTNRENTSASTETTQENSRVQENVSSSGTEMETKTGSKNGSYESSVSVEHTRKGKDGTIDYTEMYEKYVTLIKNVNTMILRHMDCDLFMQLW